MHLTIDRKRTKEHLGLVGLIVVICCTAIGGLFLKFFGAEIPPGWLVKGAGLFFIVSILLLIISYKIIIDHEDSVNNHVHGKKALVIYCGIGAFFISMVLLVFAIF